MSNAWHLIKAIESQEATLVLDQLTNDIAFELGSLIRSTFLSTYDATKDGIVISISLFSGHTLFACAVGKPERVSPDNWDWVQRKSNTVKRFGISSYLVGQTTLFKGKKLDSLGPEYAAHGGGFPIRIKAMTAAPVGAIAVSGLTQEEDHQLIVIALEKFIHKK